MTVLVVRWGEVLTPHRFSGLYREIYEVPDESPVRQRMAPVRGGGKLASNPSASTWKSAMARTRPGKRRRPSLRKRTLVGNDPPTATFVSPEVTI